MSAAFPSSKISVMERNGFVIRATNRRHPAKPGYEWALKVTT
jgi:hypothetical protein